MPVRSGIIAASALAAALAASPAEAACFARGRLLFSGPGPWTVLMETESGRPCNQGILSGGSAQEGIIAPSERGRFKSLHVTGEPANGRVDLFQGGRFAYASKPGYRGRDQFMLRLCQFFENSERCTQAQVYVTVQ